MVMRFQIKYLDVLFTSVYCIEMVTSNTLIPRKTLRNQF